jgi:peptidoglycan/LPS O-acetylase OafA/YrhL
MHIASPARNPSLDTLRGLAILLVLIGHYGKFAPYDLAGSRFGDWVTDFGHGGVLLFFVLSGFLIWSRAQHVPVRVFLLRRFAKIVPAYWLNVLFVAVAGALIAFFPSFGVQDTLGNLLFLEGALGVQPLSGIYWTLVIEVKFYLLFALVFFSKLRPLFWLVPLGAFAANAAAMVVFGRASTFLIYLPAFFVGAALAAQGRDPWATRMLPVCVALTALGLALYAPFRGWQAAVFCVVDAAAFWAVYRSGFQVRWMALLGVISYSVYLYHTTLGYPLLEHFGPALGAAWPLVLAAVILLVGGVSWLSWRIIEQRGVELARRLESRVQS